ncbi:hypothetical protein LCGC14_0800170, partial [marine sediment metagenome]
MQAFFLCKQYKSIAAKQFQHNKTIRNKRDFVAKTHVLAECGISRNEWQEFLS